YSEFSAILLGEMCTCSLCKTLLKDPVSIPCGHSYCRQCIQGYWDRPVDAGSYPCPQCGKISDRLPILYPSTFLDQLLQKLQTPLLSSALHGHDCSRPGDVACDFCTGRKLKAVKQCLTCIVSYCEKHVWQHYTVPAMQCHRLVEVTGRLEFRLCQQHNRALEVFCKTDQTLICTLCAIQEHRSHDIVVAKTEQELKQVR
uniref:FinTRIM family, member 98 n=1 Tax=Lepisosteus oculatus TaxID=7918 RepID=W5NL94_LEPOC